MDLYLIRIIYAWSSICSVQRVTWSPWTTILVYACLIYIKQIFSSEIAWLNGTAFERKHIFTSLNGFSSIRPDSTEIWQPWMLLDSDLHNYIFSYETALPNWTKFHRTHLYTVSLFLLDKSKNISAIDDFCFLIGWYEERFHRNHLAKWNNVWQKKTSK